MVCAHRYYYLYNFQRALAWIRDRHGDLLDDAEQRFVERFGQLPLHAQALMVRLLMRRGPWFRAGKLSYDEIPDPVAVATPLLAAGWLDSRHPMGLDELFALYTRAELLPLFSTAPVHAGMRKAEMLEALRPLHAEPRSHARWNPLTQEPVWRVMVGELCERLRLMFFGNLHQSWSTFVLADLGIFKYETVAFDTGSRAFRSRADVDDYLALQACRQALEDEADIDELLRRVAGCATTNPWLQARRARLLSRIGQACERAHDWDRADRAYAQSLDAGTRYRRIRVAERTGRVADAMALALAAQAAPESEEESQRVARMLPRLRRSLGLDSPALPTCPTTPIARVHIAVELEPPAAPVAVEFALRDHWHTDAAPVFYVENALVNSLFGLLCWPAIFAPLPGAFFHPFQRGPADLDAPDFVQRRAAWFDDCLARLDDGSYRALILQRFSDKRDLQSPFVFWGVLTEPLLILALDCIPAAHLRCFFQRLLRNLRVNRTGFPDLVRFWPAQRRYELVEVKGPGDRLQDNQARWLQYCIGHDIPVRVCHVGWRAPGDAMASHGRAA